MKKILVISTGGTISCSNSEQGLTPKLTFKEIISKLPQINKDVVIEGIQLMNIDSANMQPEYWLDITKQIKQEYEGYDGFVITHGTDTLAYTAAALSYLIQNSQKPIIITGSQKPIEAEGTDAVDNLSKSILLACEGIGGIFVMFNSKVILGTQAKKIKSKSDDAFISLNKPYAAHFEGEKIHWNREILVALKENTEPIVFYNELNTKVTLLKLVPGLDPEVLLYVAGRYDAIVLETYGTGSIPFHKQGDFSTAIEGISKTHCTVLVSTQMLQEGTNMSLYEVGRKTLERSPIIEGGLLSIECAIAKLMWALAITKDKEKVNGLVNKKIAFDL